MLTPLATKDITRQRHPSIPLPENRLKVAIAAGEKAYHAAREQTAVRAK